MLGHHREPGAGALRVLGEDGSLQASHGLAAVRVVAALRSCPPESRMGAALLPVLGLAMPKPGGFFPVSKHCGVVMYLYCS